MSNFDLHCHPTFKQMLRLPEQRNDGWECIYVMKDKNGYAMTNSQSCYPQLLEGRVNLICLALHPLEVAFSETFILKILSNTLNAINRLQIKGIRNSKVGFTYSDLLGQEIDNVVTNTSSEQFPGKKAKIIQSIKEYNRNSEDTLHIILTIEGGHSFYYGRNQSKNLEKIKDKVYFFKKSKIYRLLYITLTHLTQTIFSNHAYSMKVFSQKKFVPVGDGLRKEGNLFIDWCSDKKEGRRILID
ncbi:MAG: hypothetical protein H0X63_10635, partial [Flavobacteriales bacterium]|nr:hypothetical protein [Flavobacteriales bacterium]